VNISASSTRPLIAIGVGVSLIAALAIAVILLVGREPAHFPVNSPEWTIQQYLTAWERGDTTAAYAFFSERIRTGYPLEDYKRTAERYYSGRPPSQGAIVIEGTDGSGDHRTVRLTVEEAYGQGLDMNRYRAPRLVRMVREGERWRIDELLVWLEAPEPLGNEAPPAVK
jgi:hypothetical protein